MNATLGFGILLLVGGVVATAASDGHTIWYGAMIVGAINIFRGLSSSSQG